jgi:hypothetical protein
MEEVIVENDNLKKAEQLAIETKARLEKEAEAKKAELAKKEAEAKGAAKEEKAEGTKLLEEAEKQAEADAKILSSKPEELSDTEKARKAELEKALKEKEKKEESAEEKIKRVKEETQKRIDEAIGELKAAKAGREQDAEKIRKLSEEIESLKKAMQPKVEEDKASKVKELEKQYLDKWLAEDKSKPREQRREMEKEELEEWLIEDYVEASTWLTERTLRRKALHQEAVASLDETPKKLADEFIDNQQKSLAKLLDKYPSLRPSPEKLSQLKGKTQQQIDDILSAENEDYKLMLDIIQSDTKKYVESVNGPELVMQEMDKRKSENKKTITLTEEELQKRIKEAAVAEAQRIANLDEGLTSSGGKKVEKQENKSLLRLKQEEIARKAGVSLEKLDAAIERRKSIPGAAFAETAKDFNKD